jgi:hypothetical protein
MRFDVHLHLDPKDRELLWSINRGLTRLEKAMTDNTAAKQELTDAVQGLMGSIGSLDQAVQKGVAALKAAFQNSDAPAFHDAAQKITAASTQIATDAKAMADELDLEAGPAPGSGDASNAPADTSNAPVNSNAPSGDAGPVAAGPDTTASATGNP